MFVKFENLVRNGIQSRFQRNLILIGTLIAFIISILLIAPTEIVKVKMLPGKNSDTFNIYTKLATGSSIQQTKQVTDCINSFLVKEKDITDTEVFLGMGSPLDLAGLVKGSQFKNSENVAETVVNLTDKDERKEPSFLLVQRMRPIIQNSCATLYPNTDISFVEPPAGPPTLSAIVAEIYGDNAAGIRKLAYRVEDVFKHTKGLVDIDVMEDQIYNEFKVVVNTTKVSKAGISVKQLNNILYLAFKGMDIAVKNSNKYDDQIPLFLSLSPKSKKFTKKDLDAINSKLSSLNLMNKKGMLVPAIVLVDVIPSKSHPMIMSKDLHKMTNVLAETNMVSQVYPLLKARDTIISTFKDDYDISKTGLFNLELKDKHTGEIYKLNWDGEMKVTLDTFRDLGAAFIAALILIYLLMVIYYKSYTLSGIILLGSFLSIIGVIFGHLIINIFTTETFYLTATSLIGFIALIGISSRNSLLLIDFTKSLMVEKALSKADAIAYASATRAKPIFLTAVAIILASTLLASDPVFGGLGVALIFGTVAAVIASLIVVPVLLYMSDLEEHFHFHEKKAVSIEDPV
jgi:multidrug efflux pump subunit AcrB